MYTITRKVHGNLLPLIQIEGCYSTKEAAEKMLEKLQDQENNYPFKITYRMGKHNKIESFDKFYNRIYRRKVVERKCKSCKTIIKAVPNIKNTNRLCEDCALHENFEKFKTHSIKPYTNPDVNTENSDNEN